MRADGRDNHDLRPITFDVSVSRYAEGACLVCFGHTHVLCTATVEAKVPPFLRNSGTGWVTAEYGMLPRATHTRTEREAARGKQTGRTQEIQRLIGRTLRTVVDLQALGERQIKIDCDVLQADGGTRTAAISGAYVALHRALKNLVSQGKLSGVPLVSQVAALSCGWVRNSLLMDLDYEEDSQAESDVNLVFASTGGLIEIQGTAEKKPFTSKNFLDLLALAEKRVQTIFDLQNQAMGLPPLSDK